MSVDYTPDPRGLAELGRSSGMQQAMVDAAERGRQAAQAANPKGRYEVVPADVTAGFRNEIREGAILQNNHPDWPRQEHDTRALDRAVEAIESENF